MSRRAAIAVVLLLGLAASLAAAGPAPAPTLLEAIARAPQLVAAARRIDAAHARTAAAARLADPEIEAMASRVNAGASGESRDLWELSLRQPLPRRGERAADRDRAAATVTLAEAEFAFIAGDLAAEVAMSLAEATGADARAQLLATQLGRMQAALQSVEARLAVGIVTRLADRLTLQSRVAALQLQLEETQRTAADARASARGRLALAPDSPLPDFAAPAPLEIEPAHAASVAVAQARVAEAGALGKVARASANPATAVGLRFERERGGSGSQDTVGLAFSSEIPWRTRRYAHAEVRAAEADRAAALAEATAARHRISTTLARVERAERVAATARRLSTETQARLEAEHEALSRSLSVGTAPGGGMGGAGDSAVLHAVDILDKAAETRLAIVEAETGARLVRAELWRHASTHRLLGAALSPRP